MERVAVERPSGLSASPTAPIAVTRVWEADVPAAAPSRAASGEAAPPPSWPEVAAEAPAPRVPLPSYAVPIIGGLMVGCVALLVALAVAVVSPAPAAPPALTEVAAAPPSAPEPPRPVADVRPTPASFPAMPLPIPIDFLTRLEEASDQPLDVELARLFDAVQFGFGARSARLEPTLRSYVFRASSRLEWSPDTFRVQVAAPSADLAAARAALLTHLFQEAAASGRLVIGPTVGPHGLTLVSTPSDD